MTFLRRFLVALTLGFAALSLRADDMDQLNGKWSVKKKNEEGQAYTQVLEITKGKFKFQMISDGETRLYAEGDLKIEKHGPFNALKFTNIKAGRTASDTLNDVDDDRTSIYQL